MLTVSIITIYHAQAAFVYLNLNVANLVNAYELPSSWTST